MLNELRAPAPNRKQTKRVGRGQGSGHGEQSGRGHNGQKSRSGARFKAGFEGGQMPLQRRIPKFGFKNYFRKEYRVINLEDLESYIQKGKLEQNITVEDLHKQKIIQKGDLVKILGRGEIKQSVNIQAHKVSKSAAKKIEDAGGSVELVGK